MKRTPEEIAASRAEQVRRREEERRRLASSAAPVSFRLSEGSGEGASSSYLEILSSLTAPAGKGEKKYIDPELLRRAALHRSATLAIVALARAAEVEYRGEAAEEVRHAWGELARRAEREAREEGEGKGAESVVLWNPLWDALDVHSVHYPRESVGRGRALLPREQAEKMVPWIRAQENSESLEPLLRFRSPHLLQKVAKEAGALSSHQIDRLREEYSLYLACNLRLSAEERNRLALWCWDTFRANFEKQTQASYSYYTQYNEKGAYSALCTLASTREGLPGEVVDALFAWSKEKVSSKEGQNLAFSVLAKNFSTSSEMLLELASKGGADICAMVLLHPKVNEQEVMGTVLAIGGTEVVRKALQNREQAERLPREVLWSLLKRFSMESQVVSEILGLTNSTPEMGKWALEESHVERSLVLRSLARNPRARINPEIRAQILSGRCAEALEALAPLHEPDEFAHVLSSLWEIAPSRAYAFLSQRRVPEGTVLHRELLADMMSRGGNEERLLVIAKLGALRTSDGTEEVSRVAEAAHLVRA